MLLFPPKALKKDKAYLAAGRLPAISTIRRQQEASQALAFNASGGGLSSGDGKASTALATCEPDLGMNK